MYYNEVLGGTCQSVEVCYDTGSSWHRFWDGSGSVLFFCLFITRMRPR